MSKRPDSNQLAHLSHLAETGDQEALARLLAEAQFDKAHLGAALLKAAEHCSITSGHLPCIDELLTVGASLHCLPDGSTFLMKACHLGQIQLVELALDRGARVRDTDSKGQTPLHYAVNTDRGDNADVVELLMEHGADANACDREGRSPLHYAAQRGAHHSLKVLLEHHALVGLQDNSRQTALDLAIANSQQKCVEYIRARPILPLLDEEKPIHENRPRDEQRLLMSPGPDIGEELETKSGSSLSSGRHAVSEQEVAAQGNFGKVLGRILKESVMRHRELEEEQRLEELARQEVSVLQQEHEWLIKQAAREEEANSAQLGSLEEAYSSLATPPATSLRSILSLQKRPLYFSDSQALLQLQSDMSLLVAEIDQWQSQYSPAVTRAVDQWRGFALRVFPASQTKVYGSVTTQLHLPGAAVDVLIMHSPVGSIKTLKILEEKCKREHWIEYAALDANQYLPVLHVTTLISQAPVSLRITVFDSRHRGLKSTQVVKSLLDSTPQLRTVYLALKHVFQCCCASDGQRGGLNSYALFILVAARLKAEESATAAELFYRCVYFYAFECTYLAPISALSIQPPFDPPYQSLHIQDPVSPQSNLANSADLPFLIVRLIQNFLRMVYSSLIHNPSCECEVSRHTLIKAITEARTWVAG